LQLSWTLYYGIRSGSTGPTTAPVLAAFPDGHGELQHKPHRLAIHFIHSEDVVLTKDTRFAAATAREQMNEARRVNAFCRPDVQRANALRREVGRRRLEVQMAKRPVDSKSSFGNPTEVRLHQEQLVSKMKLRASLCNPYRCRISPNLGFHRIELLANTNQSQRIRARYFSSKRLFWTGRLAYGQSLVPDTHNTNTQNIIHDIQSPFLFRTLGRWVTTPVN
jgi:hypothetical protein